jgi:hypothetical protein
MRADFVLLELDVLGRIPLSERLRQVSGEWMKHVARRVIRLQTMVRRL